MFKDLRNIKVIIAATAMIITILTGCSSGDIHNAEIDTTIYETEMITTSEITSEIVTKEIRDDITMFYTIDEIIVDGNKFDSLSDEDYSLDNLIPVLRYEQTGAKLYAYESDYGNEEMGSTTYKLLLEHDGVYQIFGETTNIGFYNIFGYDGQGNVYTRDFDIGKEYDVDNDGRVELLQCLTTLYGPSVSDMDIVVYDFDENAGEYNAFHIGIDEFEDLIDEAAKIFFDEYYCPYSVNEYSHYKFDNGYSADFGQYVYCDIDTDGSFKVAVWAFGKPSGELAVRDSIGSMIFNVNYIGDGKFSVKADRYSEWVNIMETD